MNKLKKISDAVNRAVQHLPKGQREEAKRQIMATLARQPRAANRNGA